ALMLRDMIGAEYIDDRIESTLQLVDVIGDVRRPISRLALRSRANQDFVLGQPQRFPAQPDRAVFLDGQPFRAQALDDLGNLTAPNEFELVREDIELNAEPLARGANLGKDRIDRGRAKQIEISF